MRVPGHTGHSVVLCVQKTWCKANFQLVLVLDRWQRGVDLLTGYEDAGLQHDVFVRSSDSRILSLEPAEAVS